MGFPRMHTSVLASCSDITAQICFFNAARVGLDDGLCWTSLDFSLLAKHHSDTRLGGWLGAGLQAAQAWDGEDAVLLDLLGGNGNQAVDNLRAHLLLQAMFSSKSLGHGSLGHGLATSLHGLHWRKHGGC